MDTSQRRVPTPVIAGVGIGLAVLLPLVALGLLLGGRDEPSAQATKPTVSRPGAARPAPPPIEQAPWRIDSSRAGAVAHMTKADRRRLGAQRPRVGALVRDLYDVLLLRPEDRAGAIRRHFARPAARSFMKLRRLGVPEAAARVKTLRRRASIAIDAPGARRAVASVSVSAAGKVSPRWFRMTHEATLWLERAKGDWRVIAFDVEQRPVRR
ncbi:hypothetical protein BH24ACT26_BH24ACT26_15640 [soil metagenome]